MPSPLTDLDPALLRLVRKNGVDVVQQLLETGANPNIGDWDGMTPLHYAVAVHDVDIVRILLEHKADINAQTDNGTTPLHSAVYCAMTSGDEDCIRFLLDHGADQTIKNRAGSTPMDAARQYKKERIVDIFKKFEADKRAETVAEERRQQQEITARNLERLHRKKPGFRPENK